MPPLSRSDKYKILGKYLPEEVIPSIVDLQEKYGFHFRISKDRRSKLGDFRAPYNGRGYRISVNRGLNKYAFLITLIHEIAHLVTWEQYKNKVNPHGKEWQQNYKALMSTCLGKDIFPADVEPILKRSLESAAASCAAEDSLMKVLRKYDADPPIYLEELNEGTLFKISNGRVFQKGEKKRKRYICLEHSTKRRYLFSPVAEVLPLKEEKQQ